MGLPPCGIAATPAGGSKSGWHQWQSPHFMHHHRSPQVGQSFTFMIAVLHDEHYKSTFKSLITHIFMLCQEHFFAVDLSHLNRYMSNSYRSTI